MSWSIKHGDCLDVLRDMPDESVQCCVTSPPYWGLRDYGVSGQLGLERTPEEYVAKMVEVFREVRRVLRGDGTLWLNIGDSYAGSGRGMNGDGSAGKCGDKQATNTGSVLDMHDKRVEAGVIGRKWVAAPQGYKQKDLVGVPWLLAFALRADGWYLRQDIIWAKPNPMPESVRDRCTKSHEYIFLMSKSERYLCDMDAIAEPCIADRLAGNNTHKGATAYNEGATEHRTKAGLVAFAQKKRVKIPGGWDRGDGAHGTIHREGRTLAEYQDAEVSNTRNKRSVWNIATSPFPEAHFATFPPEIPEICIKAGTKEGDTVLDPFNGAGTTGLVATRLMRNYIGIELNKSYVEMAERRIVQDAPLFNSEAGGA